jgi:hypothetical protein
MFVRTAFLVFAVGGSCLSALAQRTVTNADLAKYCDQRVRAEDELRQEYARQGISYDEVMRRNKESQKQMIDLSSKLRAERLENERIAAELAAAAWNAEANRRAAAAIYLQEPDYWHGGWINGYGFGGGRRGRFGSRRFQQQGYFAGGQFWPTGPATRPQPMMRVGPRRR